MAMVAAIPMPQEAPTPTPPAPPANTRALPAQPQAPAANSRFLPPGLIPTTNQGQGLQNTLTGGVQLDGNSDSGFGGFVAGGVNNGDPNGISPGLQTGFGISQQNGQNVATAQLGGNVQAPQLGGVQFN